MSFNVIGVLRKDKKDEKMLLPIYVFVYEGRILKKKISIGERIEEEFWNIEDRQVKRKHKLSKLINAKLEKTISDIRSELVTNQIAEITTNFKKLQTKEKTKEVCFYSFSDKQIQQKNYAKETRRAYYIYLEKLKAYKKVLRLSDVTFQFLQAYEAHLRNELKNSNNTIWGNFKSINTMTNDAMKSGYLIVDPFKVYKRIGYKQTERTWLESKELEAIENFVFATNDQGLKDVGYYFLFMAYTGLRHSDAVRFRSSLHVIDNERIILETQKTRKTTNLFINDKIRAVFPYVDSVRLNITQTDFNRKLKLIAVYSGVEKKVSSHVARHTFGSSLVDAGIDVRIAQKLLAHGSANSTKIYYHVKDSNLDEAMKKFNIQR